MTDGVLVLPHTIADVWVRMTATASYGGRTEQRSLYATDDPRDDPGMLASLQASMRRYIADALGVPADERGPELEARFTWTFGRHESRTPPFGTIWEQGEP